MMLDLCYDEDSPASVDFNVVMTGKGEFVEVQGTAEGKPFTKETVDSVLALAEKGISQLFEVQQKVIDAWVSGRLRAYLTAAEDNPLIVVSSFRPKGPRACIFWVLIPSSAPSPNWRHR